MRKTHNNSGFNDVTQVQQQNELEAIISKEFRYRCANCKKLFSCEAGWAKHAEWMAACGRKCTCDVFSHGKYAYSVQGISN